MKTQRIVTQGYILYEYIPDDNLYIIVGVIDSALGSHTFDEQAGKMTDELEAEEYMKTGKVNFRVDGAKP